MNTKGQGLDEDLDPRQAPRGKNYLFAIAIDQYQYSPPLYNCVRDSKRMISVLQQQYQFEAPKTFTLFNEAATEKNIFDTFKKLVKIVQPEDNLLILYSGHGEFEAEIEEGYWIPVDAQLGDFSDYVSNSRIVKYLKALEAHHILLLVDSCFSGTLFSHRNAAPSNSALRLDTIPSRWLITAGRNEVVSDGKPGDHSPFADNIIYFLEHQQKDSLSVADLSDAVLDAVVYNSRQTPRGEPLQDVGHRGGQFFFHRKGFIPTPGPVATVPPRQTQSPAVDTPAGHSPLKKSSGGGFWIFTAIFIGVGLIALLAGPFFRPQAEARYEAPTGSTEDVLAGDTEIIQEEAPPAATDDQPEPVQPPTQSAEPISRIEQTWQSAQNTDTEAAYRRFIERFPRSQRAKEAMQKIAAKYRYQLTFSPALKNGSQVEVYFSNGKAPYQIEIILPNEKSIKKDWDSNKTFVVDLGKIEKKSSGLSVMKVIVTDYNFKKAGNMLPVY